MAEQFDFRALGPLEIRLGDQRGPRLAPMRRRLLAVLLARAGRQVTVDELSDAVWSGAPPRSAASTLLVHVHRLRQALGDPERIHREPNGYRIAVTAEEFDVLRFDEHCRRARSQRADGDHGAAVESLEHALELWRGEPYADIEPSRQIAAAIELLTEQRLSARQAHLESLLDAGRHHEAIARLIESADAHPYVERTSALLMIALYRSGRQAEALEVYRLRRAAMVDELGVEPGSLLRRVHEAVLRSDDRLEDVATSTLDRRWEPVAAPPVKAADAAVPRELPRRPDRFTGRDAELRALDGLLEAGPAPLAVVTGMGGVGKTALAVHWAHRLVGRFPDGQLFIDLRGDAGNALRPVEALAAMLGSLGVPGNAVPLDAEQAAARFRTRTGDRRMLIVLDNAASAEQVRPLLPGGPGCLVLITSRHRLAGLTARHGGTRLTLDPLSSADARDLLAGLLDVPGAEAVDLAELCGRHPLALRIAAANLADLPELGIADYTRRLADGDRLSSLQIDDGADAAVRAVFDSGYEAVPSEARRMFRLLGTAPGPDIGTEAAARLAGAEPEAAERLLDRLAAAHLVDPCRPGRYRLHDLLRVYAAERAEAEDPKPDREAAIERLLEWYLRGADACHKSLYRSFARLPNDERLVPLDLGPTEAASWLKAEHASLLAAVLHAAEHGPRRFAWLLTDALRGYLWIEGHGGDALRAGRAAAAAARAEGDLTGQAVSELGLTTALLRYNRSEEAIEHGLRAAELAEEAGYLPCLAAAEQNVALASVSVGRAGEAIVHGEKGLRAARELDRPQQLQVPTLLTLGIAYCHRGELETAVDRMERALELVAESDGYTFKANLLWNLANCHYLRGDLDRAESHLDEGYEVKRGEQGIGRMSTHDALAARIHLAAGRVETALEHADRAVENVGDFSDHRLEANALTALGSVHDARGGHRKALACFDRAIELMSDGTVYYRLEALLGRAAALLHLEERESARRDAEAALETARECGYRLLEARARNLQERIERG